MNELASTLGLGTRRAAHYFRMPRPRNAIDELDGLRAIAILLVLLRHAARPFWSETEPLLPVFGWDAGVLLMNGWMGVDLFFVLSGFLITTHICRRYGGRLTRAGVKDYLTRRVLRIVPAYYAVLLVAVLGLIPLYHVDDAALGIRIVYHMLFLQDYLPANIVVVFWSLGVEEKFYLLSPFVLMAVFWLRRRRLQYGALAALVLLPIVFRYQTYVSHPEIVQYEDFFAVFRSPFHLTFDGLAAGMLCSLIYQDRQRIGWIMRPRGANAIFWLGAAVVVWLACSGALLDEISVFDKVFLGTALCVGMSGVLLGLVCGGGPRALFRQSVLFFFSKISYSLYLVHLMLIPGVLVLVRSAAGFETLSAGAQFVIFLPVFATISITASLVLHYAVEKPFLVIKDRIPASREPVEARSLPEHARLREARSLRNA